MFLWKEDARWAQTRSPRLQVRPRRTVASEELLAQGRVMRLNFHKILESGRSIRFVHPENEMNIIIVVPAETDEKNRLFSQIEEIRGKISSLTGEGQIPEEYHGHAYK